MEGSDHYYLVTKELSNNSSIPLITLIKNMTYCFNEDLSAYIRWATSTLERLLAREMEDQEHNLFNRLCFRPSISVKRNERLETHSIELKKFTCGLAVGGVVRYQFVWDQAPYFIHFGSLLQIKESIIL